MEHRRLNLKYCPNKCGTSMTRYVNKPVTWAWIKGLFLIVYQAVYPVFILSAQCIDENTFMALSSETLKLFDFPMGHIIQVITLIKKVDNGELVIILFCLQTSRFNIIHSLNFWVFFYL